MLGPLHRTLGGPAGVARWTNACQAGLLARKPLDAEPVSGWWAVAVGRGISPGAPSHEAVRSILQWNCGGGTPLLSWWESLIQNWGSLEGSELTSCGGFSGGGAVPPASHTASTDPILRRLQGGPVSCTQPGPRGGSAAAPQSSGSCWLTGWPCQTQPWHL